MSVQELNQVHRRYIKISNAFKSAWTFHQFIQGLRKVFVEDGPPAYPADFQGIYNNLKEVSNNLVEATVTQASEQLDGVEEGLAPIIQNLLAADEQVSPGLLRQFFQRVKNYDDNILSQLVKFYLYFRDDNAWNRDRLDKADYLTTKVCEEYQDGNDLYVLRDRTRVRELAQGFWAALGREPVAEIEVVALAEEIEAMRRDIAAAESLDQLNGQHLVQRYRDFKHRLGDTFFQPKVLQAIIETNLVLKNHVKRLYHRDEQRIVAEYQQVFELEREVPIDVELKQELALFRNSVERFEQQLGGDSIRLDELAGLREQVRRILPRLQPEMSEATPVPRPPELREEAPAAAAGPAADFAYVAPELATVVSTLDDTSGTLEPKKVAFQPEVFALGIEAREVVAYRRLHSGDDCDRELEEFILHAAALRLRIETDVDEIKGVLDDSAVTRDAPAYEKARPTVRWGDFYLRRFDHLVEQAVLGEDHSRARTLQILKMRLIRSYAGLWLMLYREW